jgi:DNA-binding NarL/FixJ family response regulator
MVEGGDPYQAVFGIAVVGPPRPASAVHLTKRQSEVLELLSEGASTDQIAATLHLSKETVRNYVRQVLRALGARSRLEAVALAHRESLLGGQD